MYWWHKRSEEDRVAQHNSEPCALSSHQRSLVLDNDFKCRGLMINHLRLEDPPGVKEYTLCALCFIMNFVTQTKKKKKF